jgi:excinuclease UvrABC nuclease subunit
MCPGSTKHLPNGCGVYALFARGRLWYIGESVTLSWRMHHGIHPIRNLLDRFGDVEVRFRRTTAKLESRQIEARLIKRLRPPMNGRARAGIFDGY